MHPLKWLLNNYLKHSQCKKKVSGFTLIELLVAIIVSFLIITPLMTFMISIMDNDRKEQAKSTTEQELKATIDYMTRDLQQAVYIYDADGINAIRQYLPNYSAKSQNFPVLVFWKRQFISGGLTVSGSTTAHDDAYTYSLVAYYLINDGDTTTWSNAARIARFQIKNAYGSTAADTNFKLFDLGLTGIDLKSKMNQWKSSDGTASYGTNTPTVLVDYIDQTPTSSSSTSNPQPLNATTTGGTSSSPRCPSNTQIVPDFPGAVPSGTDVVPSTTLTPNVKISGFYVCVDSTNTVAEIHLRGNSFARLQSNTLSYDITNPSISMYFPQQVTRVQGIGYLYLTD
jgi:Tfp pilus assembly protein PilW